MYYIFVCVHACVGACVVSGSVGVCMRMRIVLLIQHATCMRYTVMSFVASGSTIFFGIIS
jgi:hypothetical protein